MNIIIIITSFTHNGAYEAAPVPDL